MNKGALGIVTGHGRLIVVGGHDDGQPAAEFEIAPGLYTYPNGDPRHDLAWLELYGSSRIFKDEFTRLDLDMGLHTHTGGAVFIAIARYLAYQKGGEKLSRDVRVRLQAENLRRTHIEYALGCDAVAQVLSGLSNGTIEVAGINEQRLPFLQAILAGEALEQTVQTLDEIIFELQASGYKIETRTLQAGGRLMLRALDPTRLVVTNGCFVARVQNYQMSLYSPGETCELDQFDTVEVVAGSDGVEYIYAVNTVGR